MASTSWVATHRTPRYRVDFWTVPDPRTGAAGSFDPDTELRVVERQGDWAHVVRPSGWSVWADARLLVIAERKSAAPAGVTLVVSDVGPNRVQVVRTIRDALGIDLAAAKDLCDAAPNCVFDLPDSETAHGLELTLEAFGAKVERR